MILIRVILFLIGDQGKTGLWEGGRGGGGYFIIWPIRGLDTGQGM